ncbi:MAG: hypothetical protein AB1592_06900 [Pseudomonadota bacterium]
MSFSRFTSRAGRAGRTQNALAVSLMLLGTACLPAAAQGPAQTPAPATPPLPPAPPAEKAAEQAQKEAEQDMALVKACKAHALAVLKGRSPSVEDIFIDMDGLTVAHAKLAVEDTKVEAVLMGEAYIQRDRSDKAHRFLCLAGADGKVLMTFFTLR